MSEDAFVSGIMSGSSQNLDAARLASAQSSLRGGRDVRKAAEEFTSVFMAQMLQPMMDSVEVNELFGGGHGEEMMRGFLVQEYGKAMAGTGRGLSNEIMAEMIRIQEQASAVPNEGAAAYQAGGAL